MRILHSYLFFSIKYAGGTSDLMFKILKAQAKVGTRPVLLTGDHMFDEELFDKLSDVELIKVPSFLDKQGFSLMPTLLFSLIFNRKKFDAVHMHIYRTFQSAVLYLFCKLFNVEFVIDAHGAVPLHKNKRGLKRVFDVVIGRRMLRDARLLVAETEVGKAEYLDIDPTLPPEKIVILSPPFDTDEFETLPEKGDFRERFEIPKDKKVISFLGRLHEIKGNDFLVKGFAQLQKVRDDCHLALIGPDDGHEDTLRSLVSEFKLDDRVTFTGFMGGKDKNEALASSDIVVQLSRFEQGAWAPIEGVLSGTPIVVTRETGAGEDVKRLDAGRLVGIDNVKELSDTFDEVLTNYEEALARTIKARDFIINNLSMNARIGEYYDLFKKA